MMARRLAHGFQPLYGRSAEWLTVVTVLGLPFERESSVLAPFIPVVWSLNLVSVTALSIPASLELRETARCPDTRPNHQRLRFLSWRLDFSSAVSFTRCPALVAV